MTLPVKLLLGVGGVGTVFAGGYGTYELVRAKTISDQLKWEGKELGDVIGISEDDDTTGLWKKLFDKYNDSGNQDKFKESTGDKSNVSINDKTKLKEHCKKIFVNPKSDTDNLKQAGFWCVKNSEKLAPGTK